MTQEEAYEQAAVRYRQAGYSHEAARCYRLAGAHRRAAEIYQEAGYYAESAAAFSDAGLPELGAWLLAHVAGQPAQARHLLGQPEAEPGLRRRLVLARCAIAEGGPADSVRPVIADVRAELADQDAWADPVIEEWAVALSEAAARYDQAALVFAAAVRGGRPGAAARWNAWSVRVLDAEVILPLTQTAA